MAVSEDGFVARGPDDDMRWTGEVDKAVFRILTGVDGVVAVGTTTARWMPKHLEGRELLRVTRTPSRPNDWELEDLQHYHLSGHEDTWLAGGQTVALAALDMGLISEAHICRSYRRLFNGVPDRLTDALKRTHRLRMVTKLLDVTVECWRSP